MMTAIGAEMMAIRPDVVRTHAAHVMMPEMSVTTRACTMRATEVEMMAAIVRATAPVKRSFCAMTTDITPTTDTRGCLHAAMATSEARLVVAFKMPESRPTLSCSKARHVASRLPM